MSKKKEIRVGCTWREVTAILLSEGYVRERSRGSHAQYRQGSRRVTVVENRPGERVAPCLIRNIKHQMGIA